MSLTILSASAGCGKTYAATHHIADRLISGEVRPERLIAMTFTQKAAHELEERIKQVLLERGAFDMAMLVRKARIGTIHSVCAGLLKELSLEIGASPRLNILDERQAQVLFQDALYAARDIAPDPEVVARFAALDWRADVQRIANFARANRIPPQQLLAAPSVEPLREMFGKGSDEIEETLVAACTELLTEVNEAREGGDLRRLSDEAYGSLKFVERVFERLTRKEKLGWADWQKLTRLKPIRDYDDLVDDIVEAANNYIAHPLLLEDLSHIIESVFHSASVTMERFQEVKRRAFAVDFTDLESRFDSLLAEKSALLRGDIDLLVVDEFQDTNPIQLSIFQHLNARAKNALWVGDPKQAIYGFRGSDAALMNEVMGKLSVGASQDVLNTCRRSKPEILRFVNHSFGERFDGQGIARTHSQVLAHRESSGVHEIERWLLPDARRDKVDTELVKHIKALLLAEPQIVCPETGEIRTATIADVAVLVRTNAHAASLARSCFEGGLKTNMQRRGLFSTREGATLFASLRYLQSSTNRLAAAEVFRNIETRSDNTRFIDEVLARDADDRPRRIESTSLAAIDAYRAEGLSHSPARIVDDLIELIDLVGRVRAWNNEELRLANVEIIRTLAEDLSALQRRRRKPMTSRVSSLLSRSSSSVSRISKRVPATTHCRFRPGTVPKDWSGPSWCSPTYNTLRAMTSSGYTWSPMRTTRLRWKIGGYAIGLRPFGLPVAMGP